MERNIFAIGDNSHIYDEKGIKLFSHCLSVTGKANPRVTLIPTASGDEEAYIQKISKGMKTIGITPTVLKVFFGEHVDFETMILKADLIYVMGGNTRNMLTLWRDWGIDILIRKAYQSGVVMAGGSAGGLCWFDEGVTDSVPPGLSSMKCMGILKGSFCPHYDGEITRRPRYHALIENGSLGSGLAAQDGVALHFKNENLEGAFSPYENKFAFEVFSGKNGVEENPLETTVLKQ